jgi:hypothetical protein
MTDGCREKIRRATPRSTYLQAIVLTPKIAKVFGILMSECLNSHGPASQTEGPIQVVVMSRISRNDQLISQALSDKLRWTLNHLC